MLRITRAISVAVLCGSGAVASAQLPLSTIGAPKNPNVPPNTSGPKVLEGIWWPEGGSGGDGGPPPASPGGSPGAASPPVGSDGDSRLQCKPQMHLNGGGGGSTVLIAQSDKQLIMAGEELSYTFKWVYIGGTHPAKITPQPNGHSIAHWEGNTLVVDTVGYADNDGKDSGKHIVERFTKNGNFLNIEIETSTKDGKTTKTTDKWQWRPDLQINESICEEDFDRYEVVNGVTESANTRKE